jgi:PTH1 family peptidyl-tRNA hydrolase
VKIVVGLGNPGRAYEATPHNVGFRVLDALCATMGCKLRRTLRFRARVARGAVGEAPVLLVRPETFMNRSGEAVAAALRRQPADASDLIVVSDDADLPIGRLRVRPAGSSGGHRGLASIVSAVGSDGFARVRVGVGRGQGGSELVDHVLTRLPAGERVRLEAAEQAAARAVEMCIREGVEAAMNAFNGWTGSA